MERRERLMPINWGPLPRLSLYQKRLQVGECIRVCARMIASM